MFLTHSESRMHRHELLLLLPVLSIKLQTAIFDMAFYDIIITTMEGSSDFLRRVGLINAFLISSKNDVSSMF